MSLETPIVFLIFQRAESTARVFERIAKVRPKTLLVVADGPRRERKGEAERVAATRRLIDHVDWPCTVLKNYSDANLGCKHRVATGLTWAFEQVEEAIVLEDDCVPDPSFFTYCEALLERFRQDERVMVVSGSNFQNGNSRSEYSYYFSKYAHCWGWATWRRAWRHFDLAMSQWEAFKAQGGPARAADSDLEANYWSDIFERESKGQIDSWAYAWMFNCWSQQGLTAIPSVNLVSNIGFDSYATHTRDPKHVLSCQPTGALPELRHPPEVARHKIADIYTLANAFGVRPIGAEMAWGKRLERGIRRLRDHFFRLAPAS